jgi:hypothetical protein
MRKSLVLGALAGMLLSVSPAFATVMVLPVDGTNLKPDEEDAIWQLIASAYQAERKDTVLPREQTKAALEEAGGYPEAARKLGASEYAYISAVRLEEKIVVNATLYDAGGKVLYSAKMSASGLDDMEITAERIAKSLAQRKTVRETREIDTVSKTESRRPNRTWVEKVNGFKVGVAYPHGYGKEIAPFMTGGFNSRVESASYFLEFGAGILIPVNDDEYERTYGGAYAEVGASWYLSKTNVSPYLGIVAMPRLASRSLANLVLGGQFGLMFFRESSSRLYIDGRVGQNVLPVGFNGYWVRDDEDEKLFPTEFTASFGVGF